MLTLRLTETEAKALDQVVRIGHYRSRADAVREGLGLLFAQHKLSEEASEQIKRERYKKRRRRSHLSALTR